MNAEQYFSYAAELMKTNAHHVTDWSQVARLSRLGIVPGQSFDYKIASKLVQEALDRSTKEGLELMKAKVPTLSRVTNGWQMNTDTMGVYGNSYLKRAIVAMVGLCANQFEDAIYPLAIADKNGPSLRGGEKYTLRFTKDQLPPVGAFWSVTMHDGDGFQVANPLNRFALGDRHALKYGKDGSLEVYIQPESPGADKETNWLPSPMTGGIGLTMRLYAPKADALDGRWNPPAVLQNSTQSVQ